MSVNCKATDHLSLHHCIRERGTWRSTSLWEKAAGRIKALGKRPYEISIDYYSNITLQIKAVYSCAWHNCVRAGSARYIAHRFMHYLRVMSSADTSSDPILSMQHMRIYNLISVKYKEAVFIHAFLSILKWGTQGQIGTDLYKHTAAAKLVNNNVQNISIALCHVML